MAGIGGEVPERSRQLKRLRETWAQRKKSIELQISVVLNRLAQVKSDEAELCLSFDGDGRKSSLFPEILTRKLAKLSNQRAELNREMDAMQLVHTQDCLSLRRCEILEERQRLEHNLGLQALALEASIEVFLATKHDGS